MEGEVMDSNGSKDQASQEPDVTDKAEPLRISVKEKVIICIDAMIFSSYEDDTLIEEIFDMIMLYMKMKKKISLKMVEFQCLIFIKNERFTQVDIDDEKDLQRVLVDLKRFTIEESDPFDLDMVFSSLAKTIELPHSVLCSESLPPPWVYHCIFLFGHNFLVPVMKETNAFDFILQSPFFSFDTVYIYNSSIAGNCCEDIARALYCLYEVVNGYFFIVNNSNIDKQYNVFAQLLGHPLIRPPQNKANFNLRQLVSPVNSE